MKILVQDFLKIHTFKELEEVHGVSCSFNKDYSKFSLNYDILSKNDDVLAQQCRGLILAAIDPLKTNEKKENGRLDFSNVCPGETKIIAYPFNRFFNYGQPEVAINWQDPNLKVFEKLDGTATFCYFCTISDQWQIATRSVSDGDMILNNSNYTSRQLFEKGLFNVSNLSFNDFTKLLNKNITYIFELTSPINQIVCQYETTKITLLGARSILDLKEIQISEIDIPIPKVNSFQFKSVNDIVDFVGKRNHSEYEGIVAVDSDFNRVKIKSPVYVAAHSLSPSLSASDRNILKLILMDQDDDILTCIPKEISDKLFSIKTKLNELIYNYTVLYNDINSKLPIDANKKDFALVIEKLDIWKAPFYLMKAGKINNMSDFFKKNELSNSFLDKILDLMA